MTTRRVALVASAFVVAITVSWSVSRGRDRGVAGAPVVVSVTDAARADASFAPARRFD